MNQKNVPFPLKPVETATVSVISEATAAAEIPAGEKINFHIGNPLQDSRLTDNYFESCTGYSIDILKNGDISDNTLSESDIKKLSLVHSIINHAVPYSPRNGYSAKKLPGILQQLKTWLSAQDEPLKYSFGESSPNEIALTNGGPFEFLRVLFSMLERFSVTLPLKLISIGFNLPPFCKDFKSIEQTGNVHETITPKIAEQLFSKTEESPVIVLIGRKLNEKERNILWQMASGKDILFCELVDLKNQQSLARESGLQESVLRLLSPAVLNKNIKKAATHFILGNSEIIKRFSAIHFELKGTPSATEREWLEYAVEYFQDEKSFLKSAPQEEQPFLMDQGKKIVASATAFVDKFSSRLNRFSAIIENNSQKFESVGTTALKKLNNSWLGSNYTDELEFKSAVDLFPAVLDNPEALQRAFLNQFIKHQTQYNVANCFVVSGSARTGLSILGKHCGIKEIVTFDWSWTYENGFDSVEAVPLFENDTLNSNGLKNKIQIKISENPKWIDEAAVVINNPHNASGYVFVEHEIRDLLIHLLEQNITVIDDLSYQNVAPTRNSVKIKTLKELANESVKKGLLRSDKLNNLITVHSLSKTDCYAGARLSVIEISHPVFRKKFLKINRSIEPNIMAVLLAYLFYRNDTAVLKNFWWLRNELFADRAESIVRAVRELPEERNPFKIDIRMPNGAMYPQMLIENFPSGISIDNISTRLSQRGIGLVPLTAFSKTAKGYEAGRKTFRLTLGGTDDAETLGNKTRRLLIELNRLLHEEASHYQLQQLKTDNGITVSGYFTDVVEKWQKIKISVQENAQNRFEKIAGRIQNKDQKDQFIQNYLPWRLNILNERFQQLMVLYSKIIYRTRRTNSHEIAKQLSKELYKENIEDRQKSFKERTFDRTVHPTQMYALKVDILADRVFSSLVYGSGKSINPREIGQEIVKEFLGLNIPVNSEEEAYEVIFDLRTMVRNELFSDNHTENILSFWGDWDGSTRPSGQGHRLVAAVLIENVRHMAYFLKTLYKTIPKINIEANLISELDNLLNNSKRFWQLLNKITRLTNQLEKSYRGLLPIIMQPGRLRRTAIKLKLSRDPLKVLFSHNNRLEKKMLQLRSQRKKSLEYYFELNKNLRKKLNDLIPLIIDNIDDPKIALLAGGYRNLLRRFFLTPRIHQKTITAADPFTVENTVHNLCEINQIATRFGNPGICMALQISMSTSPEAMIKLNRMMRRKRESFNKEFPDFPIKDLWLVPLFEDQATIENLKGYLDRIWAFAEYSRTIEQTVNDRFKEISCEIFVAGSDLSQQVGQPKSLELFKETKVFFYEWLGRKGLLGEVRIKLGCGEPMQRQGGYYSELSGKHAIFDTVFAGRNIAGLSRPAQKSMLYASSPLAGLHLGNDLRTIQSNAAERIFRFISYEQRSQLFHHMAMLQKSHKKDLQRINAMFSNTRRDLSDVGIDAIKRISNLNDSPVFREFVNKNTESFRQIVYGLDEDAVGIHVISYFISRMTPTLRDRPTVRPAKEGTQSAGQQIVERIAQTLPMSHHGSALRAIGHNRSQSAILGISQVSTGLFRTLKIFREQYQSPNAIALVLSNLAVREILYDLRMYQQTDLRYIKNLEAAFNSGNTALRALYEDFKYMHEFIPELQKALVARQGLSAADFFSDNKFKQELLHYFRPDLAVLLQNNLFNRDINQLELNLKDADPKWISKTKLYLEMPIQLSTWREKIWQLIGGKIYNQVSSFVDLAVALTTLSHTPKNESYINISTPKSNRLTNQINNILRGSADDSVRHLLYSVAEYILQLPENSSHLPIDTVRVLNDIERIIKIDSQPLSENEQARLRFYILQIARLAGENG